MAKLKIAHFAAFCPGLTGQYATVKDMIKGERSVGMDAQFIATSINSRKVAECSGIKEDGWLRTKEPDWARSADILMRHSCIPDKYINLGIPVMMTLHGRPESTFIIEFVGLMKIYRLISEARNDPRYKGWITFWKEHEFFHKQKFNIDRLYYVPAMVDLEEYNPEGKKAYFNKHNGSPNIIVADMWRHDMTPYAVIYAASLFKKKYCPTAKVHIFGLPEKKCDALIGVMRRNGTLGNVMGLAKPMSNVYRGGDLTITPHNIATRIVREALGCGLPIVAGSANPYTDFKADPRDIEAFSEQMNKCWTYIKANPKQVRTEAREMAVKEFNTDRAGEAILSACEDVLRKETLSWKPKSKILQKQYEKYEHYKIHQKTKLKSGFTIGKEYQDRYRRSLGRRLEICINRKRIRPGQSVLCLGARDGTEVHAFLDKGFFAVGIDLVPLSPSFVLKGDFQKIHYPDNAIDIIFMNCIDHVYDLDVLLEEVKRVLKPSGAFIVDFVPAANVMNDRWASCKWNSFFDIKDYIRDRGFAVELIQSFIDGYFTNAVCFRSLGGLSRGDIINSFIRRYNYKKYLEIGTNRCDTFNLVNCEEKVSVDPCFDAQFNMTSDEYFAQCDSEMFDIIFVDGLHTAGQVLRDIDNALKHLNPKGHIILHDCNPKREFLQYNEKEKDPKEKVWCGDVWKAFAKIRMTRDDLNAYVIDRDYGVGVLSKEGQTIWKDDIPIEELNWDFLENNRKELLKTREPEKWMKITKD